MDEFIKNSYIQFGSCGILISLLCFGVKKLWEHVKEMDERHRLERKDWRDITEKTTREMLQVVENNSTVMSKLSTQISGLKKQ